MSLLTVDILHSQDFVLLVRAYNELMVPNFGGLKDELEPVDVWIDALTVRWPASPYVLHVIVVLVHEDEPASKRDDEREIAGMVVCEYYPKSNCGLLTYIAVATSMQQKGLGRLLVDSVLRSLSADAKAKGHLACKAVFLETNSDAVDASKDVMVPAERRKVLQRLGFRLLPFEYVQPALGPGLDKCRDLHLAVHTSFVRQDGGVSSKDLLAFIGEFFEVLLGDPYKEDQDYLNMQGKLQEAECLNIIVP